MTVFNSQPINTDPFPYKCGKVRVAQPGYLNGAWHDEYLPRPEFDNNPNPILLDLRDYWRHLGVDRPDARCARIYLEGTAIERIAGSSHQHIDHATKVLRRLSFLGYTEDTTATEGENNGRTS